MQSGVAAAVDAPTGAAINDSSGSAGLTINSSAQFGYGGGSVNAGVDQDISSGDTIMFAGGTSATITIKGYGVTTGGDTPTSHAWTITASGWTLGNHPGTTQNYTNGTISGVTSGTNRIYLDYTASNSGGSSAATQLSFNVRFF